MRRTEKLDYYQSIVTHIEWRMLIRGGRDMRFIYIYTGYESFV